MNPLLKVKLSTYATNRASLLSRLSSILKYPPQSNLAIGILKCVHPPIKPKAFTGSARRLRQTEQDEKDELNLKNELIKFADEELIRFTEALIQKLKFWENKYYQIEDTVFWKNKDLWTLEEGILLSCSLDPSKVKLEDLIPFKDFGVVPKNAYNLEEWAKDAVSIKNLSTINYPPAFLTWCEGKGVSFPEELRHPNTNDPYSVIDAQRELIDSQQKIIDELKGDIASLRNLIRDKDEILVRQNELLNTLSEKLESKNNNRENSKINKGEFNRSKTIGALAWVLFRLGPEKYKNGKRPNASEIADSILGVINVNDFNETHMAKSTIEQRISNGLKDIEKN